MENLLAKQSLLSDLQPEHGDAPTRFDALLRVGFDHQGRYDDFAEWADAIKFACGLTRTVRTIGDTSVEVPEACTADNEDRFYDTALPVIASVVDRDEASLETAIVSLLYWPAEQ
ncbi:MAG: hypothetical protein QNJ73_12700 [Gammaproteobacteria bacterium]|nr:hypothetical protein [Gammaproteobacteria bacterium]